MRRPIDYQIGITPWGTSARFAKAKVGLARKGSTVYIAVFNYRAKNYKFKISQDTIELCPAAIKLLQEEKYLYIKKPRDEEPYNIMMREIKMILKVDKYGTGGKADKFNQFLCGIPSFESFQPSDLKPAPLAARFIGTKPTEGDRDRCYNCGEISSCGKFFGCNRCQETNGYSHDDTGDIIDGRQQRVVVNTSSQFRRLCNQQLKSIIFRNIYGLPKELWCRTSLVDLSLIECNLHTIPKELMKFSSTLTYLDLSNNKIAKLPRVFCCKMNNLKILNLSHNQIETLPIEIKFFSSLVNLDISENRLRMLPTTFADLRSLRDLKLANNNLSQLPAFRKDQIRLNHLDVSHNPLDGASNAYTTFEVHPFYDGPLSYNESVFCPAASKKKHFPSLFELSMLRIVRCDRLLKLASEESLPRSIVSTMQRDIFRCYKCSKMNILPAYNSTDTLDYVDSVVNLECTNSRHRWTFMKLLCRSCFDNMR